MGRSIVLQRARNDISSYKNRVEQNTPITSALTDFTIYDYMNAFIDNVVGPNGTMQSYLNAGMGPGVHSFIGKTQSGKTAFTVKTCGALVKKYENSVLYVRDAEKTLSNARILGLTGWDSETLEYKMDYVKFGIDHGFIYNDIRNICNIKETLRNEIMIDTGRVDMNGRPIKIFPPDVYLVDSLPSLNCINDDGIVETRTGRERNIQSELEDAAVSNNTEGLRTAGSNKLLIVKLLDMLGRYNIRLVLINHITLNTKIGPGAQYIQKQMNYLKQEEHLPGGASYLYQCTNITRTDYGSKIDQDEFGPMIHGTRNRLSCVKNKSNISGVPIEVIFDQRTGYNSLLSSFVYLQNRKYGLEGNPRSMFLKLCPSYTFTKRNLWEKLVKDYADYGTKSPLINALIFTTKRCMFYDFVLNKPDPNPANWESGPTRIDFEKGIRSK